MICQTKCFVHLFVVAQNFLGCRNYTGMKIYEKEHKNDSLGPYFVIPRLEKDPFF